MIAAWRTAVWMTEVGTFEPEGALALFFMAVEAGFTPTTSNDGIPVSNSEHTLLSFREAHR
jgi:hypothetical protein